jgi:FAD synthase
LLKQYGVIAITDERYQMIVSVGKNSQKKRKSFSWESATLHFGEE